MVQYWSDEEEKCFQGPSTYTLKDEVVKIIFSNVDIGLGWNLRRLKKQICKSHQFIEICCGGGFDSINNKFYIVRMVGLVSDHLSDFQKCKVDGILRICASGKKDTLEQCFDRLIRQISCYKNASADFEKLIKEDTISQLKFFLNSTKNAYQRYTDDIVLLTDPTFDPDILRLWEEDKSN